MTQRLLLAAILACSCGTTWAATPTVAVSVVQKGEAFTVEASLNAPVLKQTAWDVLTDFNHMAAILNLTSSQVTSSAGNTLVVRQEGVARYGFLSFPYESEREVTLAPMKRIHSASLPGAINQMESDTELNAVNHGVEIKYHAEIRPDSMLGKMFGAAFLRGQIESQFQLLAAEMQNREPAMVAALHY
jgi:hypothetical protein